MTDIEYSMKDCFISRPNSLDLQRAAVHVRAGVLAAVVGTEALLELLVIILVLVGLGVRVVARGVILVGAGEQAPEVLGHALGHTAPLELVVVHIVSHVNSLSVVVSFRLVGRVLSQRAAGKCLGLP